MTVVTKADIENTIVSLHNAFTKELLDKTEQELEESWFFKFNPDTSLSANIYHFHDNLELYGYFCSQWEEEKNGSCCIVERVRDKYLMPKINKFAEQITNHFTSSLKIDHL
ncbi:MAG: hypothetical protein KKC46_13690 [Proteobacteria bacterium]|nr:hypothetical protein [Pseudomonadota bacterium]